MILELTKDEFRVLETLVSIELDGYRSKIARSIHPEEKKAELNSIREKLAKLERENN